ncbi:PREDICTED: E3 ubiquitin-protein ligase At1g63170-like [Ipomoea nil]|uniref:E3 ubiquitin-protein ligase At1g63170-like n=1 Tax=Ipomoea nil TaxID=35883 RepID=UPI000900F073|nr:PREDICTED: E3 ubiquitin-protein ligase At1g63170-like [Ipomoea nil]
MNAQWYFITSESLCNSSIAVSFSMVPAEDGRMGVSSSSSSSRNRPPPSRARWWWYNFLRRVLNGSTLLSDLSSASNPFNSLTWMMMECITLIIQILITAYALAVSKGETQTPIWPIRIWVSGYAFACILGLMLLCCRYFLVFHHNRPRDNNAFSAPSPNSDMLIHNTTQRTIDESRLRAVEKLRSCVELFFAIWFVMGNVWALDYSRFGFGSFHRGPGAPKLHVLFIILLAWNALTYSLPFIFFVLLYICCCVPLFSSIILGYMGPITDPGRGASDERLSTLPTWKYNQVESTISGLENEHQECSICLASYREKEEIRQLPCSHIFHLKCVDQWLRITSSCPLCKKKLESVK